MTVGKESTDAQKVSRVIETGPLKGLLYAADTAKVQTAIQAGVSNWDQWFAQNGALVVSIHFAYDSTLDRFTPGQRGEFEKKFVGGLVQMANTGDTVAAKIAKTMLLTTTNIGLRRDAKPYAFFPQQGAPKYGIVLDPTKIDTGFVGADGLRNFATGDGALGDALQAFAVVVGHEFSHRFNKLKLTDPSTANPTGTVLLIENLIRQDMGLGPRLSYTGPSGGPYHPPYLDSMRIPTLRPNDPQNPLKRSGEYLRLYTFLDTPAPELKMQYPGTGQAATLTEEQKARKAANEAVMAARAGKLSLAKSTYERLEKDDGDSAAFQALKKNDFLNLLNQEIGNEAFNKRENLPLDKSRYSDLFTFDMIDLNGNGP